MNQIIFLDQLININKNLNQTLTNIKGLGTKRVNFICQKLGLQKKASFKDLDPTDIDLLKAYIEQHFIINNQLDNKIANEITSLIDTNTYRGKRHKLGYPVRGQKTKTNAKNQRYLSRLRFKKVTNEENSNVIIKDRFLNSEINKNFTSVRSKKLFFSKKKFRKKF